MNSTNIVSSAAGLNRRAALKRLGGSLLLGAGGFAALGRAPETAPLYCARNNRINQSVIHWCFKPMSVDELAGHASKMGLKSVELVTPEYWPMLKKLGLACAMTPSHGFTKGFAHVEEHAECLDILGRRIDESAEAGFPNVITFSG